MGTTNTSLVCRTLTWSSSSLSFENCIVSVIFPLCTHASFLPSVLHACTRHICQSQYLEYGGVFIIWLTSNWRGDVTPFSFTMARAAAVSGTTRVLCSYNYVIKNGPIVSCDCTFYFWQYACTYIIDLNLKSQILTSILGVAEAPPTWIPGFLLVEAHPTFIRLGFL